MPEVYNQLREITTQPRKALPRHAGFRVHHPGRQALHAADPQRQAHGSGGGAHRGRMVEEGLITKKKRSCASRRRSSISSASRVSIPTSLKKLEDSPPASAASPGAAVGRVAFTAEDAVEDVGQKRSGDPGPQGDHAGRYSRHGRREGHSDRRRRQDQPRGRGRARHGTSLRGRRGRHRRRRARSSDVTAQGARHLVKEGDWISLDGTTGEVYLGQAKTNEPDPTSHDFAKFMKLGRRVPRQVRRARQCRHPARREGARAFGAEGIGLCRTEHMFFAEDRMPHMQAMILARDEKDRRKALQKLLPMQRKDFAGLFEAMDGFPVVIRTLDPPLHEFLPKREDLMVDLAKLPHADTKTKKEMSARTASRRRAEEAAARAAEARGRAARVQPHAGPSRLPSRHHLSRDHRDAGARHLRSGRAGGEEGHQGHSRSHDSADRQREGTGEPEGDRRPRRRGSLREGRHEGSNTWSAP